MNKSTLIKMAVVVGLLDDVASRELGGRLGLAFVNSVLWRRSARPVDLVASYPDLVRYLRDAGGFDDAEQARLLAAATADPAAARAVLTRAILLRESLFALLSAVACSGEPARMDLARLDACLHEGLRHARLDWRAGDRKLGPGRLVWPSGRLARPLWEIAVSIAATLSSGDTARLKQCPGDDCGWLFIDMSRNQSRRWCDSTMCGNRARVRRHYHRTHSAVGSHT